MESAKGQEARIEFKAKVAIEVVIDERSDALKPLAALVGKGGADVGVLRTNPKRLRRAIGGRDHLRVRVCW